MKKPIKAPSDLEAVYNGNGNFIGRRPIEPLIPDIAKTPEDYIKILNSEEHSIQTKFHVLTSFVILFEPKISMLLTIPPEKIKIILKSLTIGNLEFLLDHINEVESNKINSIKDEVQNQMYFLTWSLKERSKWKK